MSQSPWLGRLNRAAVAGDRFFIASVRAARSVGRRASAWLGAPARMLSGRALAAGNAAATSLAPEARALEPEAATLDLLAADESADDLDAVFGVPLARRGSTFLVSEPPGVVPLWRALGTVVSQHAESGYRSLQFDDRFWALVRLIQSCTDQGSEPQPQVTGNDGPAAGGP